MTLVCTAHIPLISLARSRHFSSFSSSLALTLTSSGIVANILSQLPSFCQCSPSTVYSCHFHDLFAHLKLPKNAPSHKVSFCTFVVYVSFAHELTIWLIGLLVCLHIIIVTSCFHCFISFYFLRNYQQPLAKVNIQLKILMERIIINISISLVGINHARLP